MRRYGFGADSALRNFDNVWLRAFHSFVANCSSHVVHKNLPRSWQMLASCIADLSSPLISIDPASVHSNIVICDVNTQLIDPAEILNRLSVVDDQFQV